MEYEVLRGTIQNLHYFQLFKVGDEMGLNFFYKHLHGPVYFHGMQIVNDDFLVSTFLQEAFLKAWYLRERITSALHLLRFLRLCVRWECSAYFASAVGKFSRRVSYIDYAENTFHASVSWEEDALNFEEIDVKDAQLDAILKAIRYLPATKQNVMRLYAHYGLSEKEIAQKFKVPYQTIARMIRKSTNTLKEYLIKTQMTIRTPLEQYIEERYRLSLTPEQAEVYRLRAYSRLSFDQISIKLGKTPERILNLYFDAVEILKTTNPNAAKRSNSNKKNSIVDWKR
ncbi:sigma-70 family RNA polymerase sigma factor [Chitinophaga pollutisoli]|uniref:Sigma-70 family RNA polymerase sigma factor n=1 Tax=Chitinophaga pollutisoli TaxID=3133966 RepID=A0ABZ2YMS1_9BACT|nr:sigma-70 family RNA polymerase sigma factor [Chitinophaga rhizosphaerae]